jgi:hypothetical protein
MLTANSFKSLTTKLNMIIPNDIMFGTITMSTLFGQLYVTGTDGKTSIELS